MSQSGATLQSIEEEWRGAGRGVEQRRVGADGVVRRGKKGEAGSSQRGRAVHGTRMKLQ